MATAAGATSRAFMRAVPEIPVVPVAKFLREVTQRSGA